MNSYEKHIDKFEALSDLLISENQKYNLTRIVDPDQVKSRHFLDSLAALDVLNRHSAYLSDEPKLIDIGSGAGLPSLALAIVLDKWQFTSVEATGKKSDFQKMAAEKLGLNNFKAVNARAEDLGNDANFRNKFDFVTARAVGHLALIAELACPLLRDQGVFLAWKGQKYQQELTESESILKALRADYIDEYSYNLPDADSDLHLVTIRKTGPTPKAFPRQYNQIKKSIEKLIS